MRYFRTGRLRLLGLLVAMILPVGSALAEATYTVRPGDTSAEIAQKFSVPLDKLVAYNNLANPDRIYVGQVLRIPADENAPEPAVAETPAAPDPAPAATTPEQPVHQLTARELAEQRTRYLEQQRRERQSQQGNALVEAARRYLGTPYHFGGLTSRGLDCSGLVVRAMLAQGRNVPHQSGQLFRMGKRVSYSELQPGDLVFFNTRGGGVSHVGIWVGENRFIHASTRNGVRVDKVEGYYAKRLVGARRL